MKHYYQNLLKLYCLVVIYFLQTNAKADSNCATQLASNQASYILETQAKRDAIINIDSAINDTIAIPVVAHILEAHPDSLNYSTLKTEEVDTALLHLNNGFSQAGFHFNLCSTNTISHSTSLNKIYYSTYNTSNEFIMIDGTLAPRALNIYFVPEAIAPSGETVCGWASFPAEYSHTGKNWIVIDNECATNGSTLIHEVGHYFNLYHTHQGKNPNLGIMDDELVDCSNCGPAVGDGVEDTPAEPYMNGLGIDAVVNDECDIICGEYRDANGDAYNFGSETSYNYMSYAPFKCRSYFTPKQIERMKKSYLVDRNYLSNLCPGIVSDVCDPFKDKKVLHELFYSLGGPIPEDWVGVTFNDDDCVTKIELSSSGLSGEIPIQIEDLSYLTTLNLSNNSICGTLPPTIGNLLQLDTLNLSNNLISGEIPAEIEGLSNLVNLDLSNNSLSDYIPYQLAQLYSLQQLNLSGNDFGGCIHKDLNNFISQVNHDDFNYGFEICNNCNINDWQALKHIYQNMGFSASLNINHISGGLAAPLLLVDSHPVNCNLDTLPFLSLNRYGRVGQLKLVHAELSGPLSSEFGLLNDIEHLILFGNNINDSVPEFFSELKRLKSLNLSDNDLLTDCFPVKLTRLCGQATISTGDYLSSGFLQELWNEFCQGLGGYCEDVTDYVMPGDFNNDKKVNSIDLIYWSQTRYLEDTIGTPRENAHIGWLPQEAEDWDGNIWGVNKKHFDANGDSIICKADLIAFNQNFYKGTSFDDGGNSTAGNSQFTLSQESDGANGFNLKIEDLQTGQPIVALFFTIDLGESSHQVSFIHPDGENVSTPIFENIHYVEGTNLVEVALLWDELAPAPIDGSFGKVIVQAHDNGDGYNFKIEDINIFNTGGDVLSTLDVLNIAFDTDNTNNNSACVMDSVINGDLSGGYIYNVSNSIISSANISAGCTNINFLSGGFVELNPGFNTQHGVVFCARITEEPCEVDVMPKLGQNIEMGLYPNPARNQTTLTFELEGASTVNVMLTDVTCKPVIELLNNSNKEEGLHQISIDTSRLPVGIYYCTLKDNETISTQKLLVVK